MRAGFAPAGVVRRPASRVALVVGGATMAAATLGWVAFLLASASTSAAGRWSWAPPSPPHAVASRAATSAATFPNDASVLRSGVAEAHKPDADGAEDGRPASAEEVDFMASNSITVEAPPDARGYGASPPEPPRAATSAGAARLNDTDAIMRGASLFRVEPDDPLSRHLTGFPVEPMTLDSLAPCAPLINIVLKDGFVCQSDPTCRACSSPRLMKRFDDVRAAFRAPALDTARRRYIAERFPVRGQVVVVFAFNLAHTDLFLNWACSVHKLGLDPRAFTLAAPCDAEAEGVVKRTGFHYAPTDWISRLSQPIRAQESHWGSDHADINNVMLFLMVDLVEMGYHVLVHDADVAWIKDPRPFLLDASRRRDFIGMLAPFWTSMGPVNTGFLFLAPTRQLWVFLKSMENAAVVKGTSDQRLWNHVLRHYTFQQLEWRLLPQEVIYKYSGRHAKRPGPDALVVHALGSKKRAKLQYLNMWSFSEACPFFDKEAAKQVKDT